MDAELKPAATSQEPPELLKVWGVSRSFEREVPIWTRIASWWSGGSLPRVQALSDVELTVRERETVGILGESGSGKSTLAKVLMGLYKPDAGEGRLMSNDLFDVRPTVRLRNLRRMQMVFQDPFGSLNPRMSIRQILAEPLKIHGLAGDDLDVRLGRSLEEVGLEAAILDRYPAEFSGGQRQRIGICRALLLDPQILIADEAVSALDVSVQAQILELLVRLKDARKLSLIFISHDVAVVRQLSDRIVVLFRGRLVESLDADCLLKDAAHPYTRRLVGAALALREGGAVQAGASQGGAGQADDPQAGAAQGSPVPSGVGTAGDLKAAERGPIAEVAAGCPYAPSCPEAFESCVKPPQLRDLHPGHRVACWRRGS